jgi:hypothetical protein
MASIVLYGFPGSTYVQIVQLVLTPFHAQSSAISMKGAVPFKNQFSRLRSVLSRLGRDRSSFKQRR